MNARALALLIFGLAFAGSLFACATAADAHARSIFHGGLYVGDVIVEPGERVDGDLTVLFGNATLGGDVDGDVTVVGGSAYVGPQASVRGQINAVGGDVVGPQEAAALGAFPHQDGRMFWPVAWDVVVIVAFLLFPRRTRMALDRLERHPGYCTGAGIAAWIAVVPLAAILLCTVLLIPLIPLEAIALLLSMFLGQAAIALLLGRRFIELVAPTMTPSPLAALCIGLALVTAAELVPIAGAVIGALVAIVGVGAVALAFVREESFTGTVGRLPRPPVSGPPMPVSK